MPLNYTKINQEIDDVWKQEKNKAFNKLKSKIKLVENFNELEENSNSSNTNNDNEIALKEKNKNPQPEIINQSSLTTSAMISKTELEVTKKIELIINNKWESIKWLVENYDSLINDLSIWTFCFPLLEHVHNKEKKEEKINKKIESLLVHIVSYNISPLQMQIFSSTTKLIIKQAEQSLNDYDNELTQSNTL